MTPIRQHLVDALPPEAVALRERLADESWHPSEQQLADADRAVTAPRQQPQAELELHA